MGTLGKNAATAAGYTPASYQNVVYVFPRVSACGWAGLAYVGSSGVWINGYNQTSVYGHELGHNFGLLHAGSLRCGSAVIGGTCGVSEYGDPFDIMGNQSAMHFNAAQKLDLGWITSSTVVTHTTGSGTYVLNPIETANGGAYAVRIPVASNRTYWLEYRQPIGFDAGMASYPNNGAQVRLASPFETLCSGCDSWSNDTELLDMTPATSTFTDAALVVGKSYADGTYGINISVLSASSSGLTVQVTAPGGTTVSSTTLASSVNPANAGVSVTFTATVTGVAPTGNVAFTANGTTIAGCGAVALTGSGNVATAACITAALAAGTHSIVASYGGNAGNAASASGALSQVINVPPPAATTTTLATNINPAIGGLTVIFTATVIGSAPTGVVAFTDGGSTLSGCGSVALTGSGNTRTALCSTTGLTVGNHSIIASYGGDSANSASTSAALTQVLNAAPAGVVWVQDAVPSGATTVGIGEGWSWMSANPTPFSGALAHQSALVAGLHQHYFYRGQPRRWRSAPSDTLYTYVYLDPANPPTEVMLQWHDGGSWEHRAYWGANSIGVGRRRHGEPALHGAAAGDGAVGAPVGAGGAGRPRRQVGRAEWPSRSTTVARPGTAPGSRPARRRRRAGSTTRAPAGAAIGWHRRGLELDEHQSDADRGRARAPVGTCRGPAPALLLRRLDAAVGRGQRYAVRVRVPGSGESAEPR